MGYLILIDPDKGISLQRHEGRVELALAQSLVRGYVEVVHGYLRDPGQAHVDAVELLANEDGLALGLTRSPLYGLVGPVAIVGVEAHDEDGFIWTALTWSRCRMVLRNLGLDPDHMRELRAAADAAERETGDATKGAADAVRS